MDRFVETCRRLADEREVRLASLAGVPLFWVAIAWRDVWALLLTPLTVFVTTLVLRSLARRRANDDEFVL
jgi:hypothetical protein